MNLDARTLDDYLDEWLYGLSAPAKKELAALVRACGGDESALERDPRKPPKGRSS